MMSPTDIVVTMRRCDKLGFDLIYSKSVRNLACGACGACRASTCLVTGRRGER